MVYRVVIDFSLIYVDSPSVTQLTPLHGDDSGGTIVSLLGSGFFDVPTFSCQFDCSPVTQVTATYISNTVIICQAPSCISGTVALDISINTVDVIVTGLSFTYESTAVLDILV